MKTIRMKLTLLVCIIAFVACVSITSINAFMLNKTAVHGMDTCVTETAKAYASDVGNQIAKFKAEIKVMAANPAITATASVEELTKFQSELVKTYTSYSEVAFADENGVPYDLPTGSLLKRDYFQAAIRGEEFIGSPVSNQKNKRIVLYVSSKVNNGKDYNGIVFATLENDVFSKVLKNVSIGNKGYAFIIDNTGTIVAHKDNSMVENFTNYVKESEEQKKHLELGEFTKNMLNNKEGSGEVKIDSATKYIAYTPVENTNGWILAIVADKDEMMTTYKQSLNLSIVAALGVMILAFLVAFIFGNTIGRPITEITKRIQMLSSGDLRTEVPPNKSRNEIGKLSEYLSVTISSLRAYIGDIHAQLSSISNGDLTTTSNQEYIGDFANIKTDIEGIQSSMSQLIASISSAALQVSDGAGMISGSSLELSQGATEQASSVEQLNESLNKIAAKTKLNAENAGKANELVTAAKDVAENGKQHMDDMMAAMETINESSQKINNIINLIDDIAFQTNILALNAAVEAARAGQQGKGFAVVADEVRNLAQKSACAAKESSEMIAKSIKDIEEGVKTANVTAAALSKIIDKVENATSFVSLIANASFEQAADMDQISVGISKVSQVVQTNAATSEETAAASEELSSQSTQLESMINVFKIRD